MKEIDVSQMTEAINDRGEKIRVGRKVIVRTLMTPSAFMVKIISFHSPNIVWAKSCKKCTIKICDESTCRATDQLFHINRCFLLSGI
jgi:hypothetical protein